MKIAYCNTAAKARGKTAVNREAIQSNAISQTTFTSAKERLFRYNSYRL